MHYFDDYKDTPLKAPQVKPVPSELTKPVITEKVPEPRVPSQGVMVIGDAEVLKRLSNGEF